VRPIRSKSAMLATAAVTLGLGLAAGFGATPAHAAADGYYSVQQCNSYGACDTFYGDGSTLNEVVATVGETAVECESVSGWGVWAGGTEVASMPTQTMCGAQGGGSSTNPVGESYTFGIYRTFAAGTCITASPVGYYCLP
jgi:hypothetical protein